MAAKKEKTVKVKKEGKLKTELKKITWPSVKDIAKYTFATIVVVLILAGYFSLLNLALSLIKGAIV